MVEDVCKINQRPDSEVLEDLEILEEKCWYQKYKLDSRPFLFRDASHRLPPEPLATTMKVSYLPPKTQERPKLGVRKSKLMEKFKQEAYAEVQEERRPKTPKPDYTTMYERCFQVEGYEPDDKFYTKHDDLYKKYPLYSAPSPPTTFVTFQLKQNPNEKPRGVTDIFDNNKPFTKFSEFSKPVYEEMYKPMK